jgi:hypothetical protein
MRWSTMAQKQQRQSVVSARERKGWLLACHQQYLIKTNPIDVLLNNSWRISKENRKEDYN